MTLTDAPRHAFRSTLSRFSGSWRALALTDLAWKIVAFVALTPLVTLFFRTWMALSGPAVVADQDLLAIFAPPLGAVVAVVIGAMLLAILALEQAALMAVLQLRLAGLNAAPATALRFALARAWPVLRLASRVVGGTLLVAAPCVAVVAATYAGLLRDHDINFYLKARPPEFLAAAAIGAATLTALAFVLLRMYAGWFYALPLLLFEGVSPTRALRESRRRAFGHRLALVAWIAGWGMSLAVCSAVVSAVTIGLARTVVPMTAGSIGLLTLTVGVTLLVWGVLGLAVNLLGNSTAAVILFTLYRDRGGAAPVNAASISAFDRGAPRWILRLTPARLTRWAIAGAAIAFAVGVTAVQSAHLPDTVWVAAHRGSSTVAPENSLSAVKQAIADEADWIEIDVQETADGEVIVAHDSDFMKLAGVATRVWDATLADVRRIDIGSRFSPAFRGEHPPTLGEVLDACKGRARVLIELKSYGHDQRLQETVGRLVEERGMAGQVAVMSLELDMVRRMKALRPGWKVGWLLSVAAGDLGNTGADFLAVNAAFATRRFVRSVHRLGMKVYVWTVDDPSTMSAMMGRGVDGVITNRPAVGKSVVAQRASMSPALRLLLELADVLGVKPKIGEL
jgi:glycerophosphoryl diester phosphodiesterase